MPASVARAIGARRSLRASIRQGNDQCHAIETGGDSRRHPVIALSHIRHRRVTRLPSDVVMPIDLFVASGVSRTGTVRLKADPTEITNAPAAEEEEPCE